MALATGLAPAVSCSRTVGQLSARAHPEFLVCSRSTTIVPARPDTAEVALARTSAGLHPRGYLPFARRIGDWMAETFRAWTALVRVLSG